MALSAHTRAVLKTGLASNAAGKDVADIIDAGSGTLSPNSRRVIHAALANHKAASLFIAAVDAGTAINSFTKLRLKIALGDSAAMLEIAAALLA